MDVLAEVLTRLPQDIVTRDRDIIAAYTTDFRRQYTGSTRAVLRPRHIGEVQHIVRCCAEFRVPLVPQGGNTGYCAAATPSDRGNELVVSLERMNRVRRAGSSQSVRLRRRRNHSQRVAASGIRRGPAAAARAWVATIVPHRWKSLDQRRRHLGVALWDGAGPRPRS